MDFPVYYAGIRPVDSKGRGVVSRYDVPIHCGEVEVHPGDLIYADFDGIVVVPKHVEGIVLERAKKKVLSENKSRKELMDGKSLREVFDRYGVL